LLVMLTSVYMYVSKVQNVLQLCSASLLDIYHEVASIMRL